MLNLSSQMILLWTIHSTKEMTYQWKIPFMMMKWIKNNLITVKVLRLYVELDVLLIIIHF